MILPYDWKDKLKPSNLRQTINENAAVMSIIAVVVVILTIAYLVHEYVYHPLPNASTALSYYYDTSDQKLLALPANQYPPLIGKTGKPTVFLAICYTCSTSAHKKIAYLEKYSEEFKSAMEKMLKIQASFNNGTSGVSPDNQAVQQQMQQLQMQLRTATQMGGAMLVRSVKPGSHWYPTQSPEGQRICTLPPCPNGGKLRYCVPH